MSPALFIDKDGTLVENVPYNVDPARVRLTPGIAPLLAAVTAAGFRLFVVSNQPGVALGRFGEQALAPVAETLRARLGELGIVLDGCYFCPHHPAGAVAAYAFACDCRKPAPGLLLRAAAEHDIDLGASWMIGDILDDVEAGRHAGCRTILLDNGNETEWRRGPARLPDFVIRKPWHAVPLIGGAAAWPHRAAG